MIWDLAVIRASRRDYIEAHDAIARVKHSAGWASTVCLLEPILKDDLIARLILREVQDYINALGHAQINAFGDDGLRQNVSVPADHDERLSRAQIQLIETRRPAVQNAKAILPRLNLKERLYDSIDSKLVTQDAIRVERIE